MGGPGAIITNTCFLDIKVSFWSRWVYLLGEIETVKHVDSSGINRLAVRLQKLYFMKPLFHKIQKVKQVKSRYESVLAFL